jgi:cation diffusion facilitator CzcD-associated flavoprotein CzcO
MFVDDTDLQRNTIKNLTASMKASLAKKPELISLLVPTFGVGCRRLTPGVGYLEAMCEDNVDVITGDIARVTAEGIVTSNGTERKVDTIICATVGGIASYCNQSSQVSGFRC